MTNKANDARPAQHASAEACAAVLQRLVRAGGTSTQTDLVAVDLSPSTVSKAIRSLEAARSEGKHRFVHAFPSVENAPSNAICRKVGFTLLGERDFEYPPGHSMRSNDWRFDLSA